MKIKTMTVGKAYDLAIQTLRFDFGDGFFTMVGWQSPETKKVTGPFFVTITGDTAIEVDRFGRYTESYPAKADCYFPWIEYPTNSYKDRVRQERGEPPEGET